MACNCTTCVRWWLVIINIGFLFFALFFFAGFIDTVDNQPWFKPIRNNCIGYYLILFTVGFIALYSSIGMVFSCVKKKNFYLTYFILILITALIEIAIVVISLNFKDIILKTVENKWFKSKYIENRFDFENHFKCCGFNDYNPKDGCGYYDKSVYLCGPFVEACLIQYFVQIRWISLYLISTQILPTILSCILLCCNQEENEGAAINELESSTSLYDQLIN